MLCVECFVFLYVVVKNRQHTKVGTTFFLFLEVFINDMQFMYTCSCLNSSRYELHKFGFLNFLISKVLCMVSKFPLHQTESFGMAAHDLLEYFGNSCNHP